MIEVSIGAMVEAEQRDGRWHGQEYHGVWRNIVSDHVAFLSEQEVGACSNAAGCGAPRVAVRHLVTASGIRMEGTMGGTVQEKFAARTFKIEEGGVSDIALRRGIDAALRAVEPGYMGIDAVYPDDAYVIYYVAPEEQWKMKRSSYKVGKDGAVALTGKAVEVEPVTTYEPVTAAQKAAAVQPHIKAADCGCKDKGARTMEKSTRAELIAALVTDKHSGFKDGDEAFLETASDARLEEFRSAADANKTTAGQLARQDTDIRNLTARLKVSEERLRVAESPLSEEEFEQRAPERFKAILNERKAQEDGLRASLISQLKDLGANTEEELKKKTTTDLQTLASYARIEVPDFSGRGVPRMNSGRQETNDDYIPPDPYATALKAREKTH